MSESLKTVGQIISALSGYDPETFVLFMKDRLWSEVGLAKEVQRIYQRQMEKGCVRGLMQELSEDACVSFTDPTACCIVDRWMQQSDRIFSQRHAEKEALRKAREANRASRAFETIAAPVQQKLEASIPSLQKTVEEVFLHLALEDVIPKVPTMGTIAELAPQLCEVRA